MSKQAVLLFSGGDYVPKYATELRSLHEHLRTVRSDVSKEVQLIVLNDAAKGGARAQELAGNVSSDSEFVQAIRSVLGAEKSKSTGNTYKVKVTRFCWFETKNPQTNADFEKDTASMQAYLQKPVPVIFVVPGGNTNWLMAGLSRVPRIVSMIKESVSLGRAGYVSFSAGTVAAGVFARVNVDNVQANRHGEAAAKAVRGLSLCGHTFRPHCQSDNNGEKSKSIRAANLVAESDRGASTADMMALGAGRIAAPGCSSPPRKRKREVIGYEIDVIYLSDTEKDAFFKIGAKSNIDALMDRALG